MKIVFVTENISKNSLGRTLCLWELAKANGWEATVVSTHGDEVWGPLRDTDFAAHCSVIPAGSLEAVLQSSGPDLVVALKPLTSTLGVTAQLCRDLNLALLLDVDDPDLEGVLAWSSPARRIKRSLTDRRAVRSARSMARLSRDLPKVVSNPYLQARHGGTLIPHTRRDPGPGARHVSRSPHVAFVGSDRPHKGLEVLREAVTQLQEYGVGLTVTASPRPDARPWENWVGTTGLGAGLDLLAGSDVVVLPSLNRPLARGQLPVKLVDAMLAGRAIAVSDVNPMPWALGGNGLIVRPGSVDSVAEALRHYVDPTVRQRVGDAARRRALEVFTLESNMDEFRRACLDAVDDMKSR